MKELPRIEQSAFRFRNDDGDEDGATWLDDQDTNIIRGKNINTRIRVLVDAVGNPTGKRFQLEYRKKTEGDTEVWVPVQTMYKIGLWVWNIVTDVLGDSDEENILLNECIDSGITDLYCYTFDSELVTNASAFRSFISRCTQLNIRVWGLDGTREYFSDLDGPQQLYDDVAAILSYNAGSDPDERFYGFHMDIEPPDSGDGTAFHNGIVSSALSTTPGSGDWQDTEALDREFLMRDWIDIHKETRRLCNEGGIKFGTTLPTFLDDYFGEPIVCTYDGVEQNVFIHLCNHVDHIALMSYNTNPDTVINSVAYEFRRSNVPEIGFSFETVAGVGSGISYGDTAGKDSKSAMWVDYEIVDEYFAHIKKYRHFNIHDWSGYKALSPASNNTNNPLP